MSKSEPFFKMIRAGRYECNGYTIERAPTGWWWVYSDRDAHPHFGVLATDKPFHRQKDACEWARNAPANTTLPQDNSGDGK